MAVSARSHVVSNRGCADTLIVTSFASRRSMLAKITSVEGGNRAGKGELDQTSCLRGVDLNEDLRKALVRMMMKASDLGCCAKPWPVARHW
eukprot:COSAG02_NODE_2684_length_8241_cov_14.362442_4_plen_91_part_00